jgi:hypothetical protein
MTLIEIGPRFVLTPIRIFEGAFGGATVFSNPGKHLRTFFVKHDPDDVQNSFRPRLFVRHLKGVKGTDTGLGRRRRKRARGEKNFGREMKMNWPCPKYLPEGCARTIAIRRGLFISSAGPTTSL